MVLYECPGFLVVRYEQEKDYILFRWSDFSISFEDLVRAHEAALKTAVERACSCYLADCSYARDTLSPEIVVWWRETWLPKMVASGVRVIVTVESTSTLASLSNRNWQRESGTGMKILNVPSLSEAEAALEAISEQRRGDS
jgi:hypothetical protein